MRSAPVTGTAPAVAPTRASLAPAFAGAGALAIKTPPASVANQPVMAKLAPPPAPVSFAAQQQQLASNGGRPLAPTQVAQLRQSAPPNAGPTTLFKPAAVTPATGGLKPAREGLTAAAPVAGVSNSGFVSRPVAAVQPPAAQQTLSRPTTPVTPTASRVPQPPTVTGSSKVARPPATGGSSNAPQPVVNPNTAHVPQPPLTTATPPHVAQPHVAQPTATTNRVTTGATGGAATHPATTTGGAGAPQAAAAAGSAGQGAGQSGGSASDPTGQVKKHKSTKVTTPPVAPKDEHQDSEKGRKGAGR